MILTDWTFGYCLIPLFVNCYFASAQLTHANLLPRSLADPQFQMARLIQAVVNSATNDGDLHVEFNAPNIMSINLPVHVMTAAVHPPQARPATGTAAAAGNTDNADTGGAGAVGDQASAAAAPAAGAATSAGASVGSASTSTGTRSGEQRANTLPTTATQTRSTSRPQIQIGGNNNWAGRIAPTHTAFDRFLPCNSHHIREPEPLPQNNNNNNNASSSSSNNVNSGQARVSRSSSGTRRAANNAPNSMGEFRFLSCHVYIDTHRYMHVPPHTHKDIDIHMPQIHTDIDIHVHTSIHHIIHVHHHYVSLIAFASLRCMLFSS